jgi:hypothetical protein
VERRPEVILQAIDSLLGDAAESEEWERLVQLAALQERVEAEAQKSSEDWQREA